MYLLAICRSFLFRSSIHLKIELALTGVAQWIGRHPANWKVTGQFPVRAHAWSAGQVPRWGCARGNRSMFLSLPSLLSKNKFKNIFFNWVVFCCWVVCVLYVFWILTPYLLDMWFANIFSHLVGCLLVLLIVFFAAQKILSLMVAPFAYFCFVSLVLGIISKNKKQTNKNIVKANVKEIFSPLEFYYFRSYIQVVNQFWVNLYVCYKILI